MRAISFRRLTNTHIVHVMFLYQCDGQSSFRFQIAVEKNPMAVQISCYSHVRSCSGRCVEFISCEFLCRVIFETGPSLRTDVGFYRIVHRLSDGLFKADIIVLKLPKIGIRKGLKSVRKTFRTTLTHHVIDVRFVNRQEPTLSVATSAR